MTPAELKQAGQMESLWATTPDIWADFVAILADAPFEQTSNDTRAEMDRKAIPESARGGLYQRALRANLLIRKMTSDGYPARIPSTGTSAHAAYVQVYRRTA